jgi:predicted metal-binding protein
MKRVAIFYCKRIQDHTCIACAKCFKGVREKAGEFAGDEELEIVALTDCGDCPGLLMPRVVMIKGAVEGLEGEIDQIHLGTCVKLAKEHGECPLDLDALPKKIEAKTGIPVVVGTHPYI